MDSRHNNNQNSELKAQHAPRYENFDTHEKLRAGLNAAFQFSLENPALAEEKAVDILKAIQNIPKKRKAKEAINPGMIHHILDLLLEIPEEQVQLYLCAVQMVFDEICKDEIIKGRFYGNYSKQDPSVLVEIMPNVLGFFEVLSHLRKFAFYFPFIAATNFKMEMKYETGSDSQLETLAHKALSELFSSEVSAESDRKILAVQYIHEKVLEKPSGGDKEEDEETARVQFEKVYLNLLSTLYSPRILLASDVIDAKRVYEQLAFPQARIEFLKFFLRNLEEGRIHGSIVSALCQICVNHWPESSGYPHFEETEGSEVDKLYAFATNCFDQITWDGKTIQAVLPKLSESQRTQLGSKITNSSHCEISIRGYNPEKKVVITSENFESEGVAIQHLLNAAGASSQEVLSRQILPTYWTRKALDQDQLKDVGDDLLDMPRLSRQIELLTEPMQRIKMMEAFFKANPERMANVEHIAFLPYDEFMLLFNAVYPETKIVKSAGLSEQVIMPLSYKRLTNLCDLLKYAGMTINTAQEFSDFMGLFEGVSQKFHDIHLFMALRHLYNRVQLLVGSDVRLALTKFAPEEFASLKKLIQHPGSNKITLNPYLINDIVSNQGDGYKDLSFTFSEMKKIKALLVANDLQALSEKLAPPEQVLQACVPQPAQLETISDVGGGETQREAFEVVHDSWVSLCRLLKKCDDASYMKGVVKKYGGRLLVSASQDQLLAGLTGLSAELTQESFLKVLHKSSLNKQEPDVTPVRNLWSGIQRQEQPDASVSLSNINRGFYNQFPKYHLEHQAASKVDLYRAGVAKIFLFNGFMFKGSSISCRMFDDAYQTVFKEKEAQNSSSGTYAPSAASSVVDWGATGGAPRAAIPSETSSVVSGVTASTFAPASRRDSGVSGAVPVRRSMFSFGGNGSK